MIKRITNYIKDDKFKITMVNNSVDVINFDKILDLTEKEITLIKENKLIFIKGNNLKLTKLLDNEILIVGLIKKIEM